MDEDMMIKVITAAMLSAGLQTITVDEKTMLEATANYRLVATRGKGDKRLTLAVEKIALAKA